MEYVEELIKRTKIFSTLEEAYHLENEILEFLNSEDTPSEQKQRLKSEGFIEMVAIASDGYKFDNKLEHYSPDNQSTSK